MSLIYIYAKGVALKTYCVYLKLQLGTMANMQDIINCSCFMKLHMFHSSLSLMSGLLLWNQLAITPDGGNNGTLRTPYFVLLAEHKDKELRFETKMTVFMRLDGWF